MTHPLVASPTYRPVSALSASRSSPRAGGDNASTPACLPALSGLARGPIRRAPINLKRLTAFLEMPEAKREHLLESQTPGHLNRLATLLKDRERSATDSEKLVIAATLAFIPRVVVGGQAAEVKHLGRGANWASAGLIVDGKLIASEQATTSGLAEGSKLTKWGTAGKGTSQKEIRISHNDSEATVFAKLSKKLQVSALASASDSIELVFFSTNGACNGCKGRINEFVRQEILPHLGKGIAVQMRYRYHVPPGFNKKRGARDLPTAYGWAGDTKVDATWFEHLTTYQGSPRPTTAWLPDPPPEGDD